MRLSNALLAGSVAVALFSVVCYALLFYVGNIDSLTCFGFRSATKPFVETQLSKDVSYVFHMRRLVERVETKYQSIEVYTHVYFGNVLVIDGSLQITERDEANYHEMMAHVPLAYLPNAKKALVIGGGDGGALLRVLQHPNIEKAVLVDIDMKAMRDISRKYFPLLYRAYVDPRTSTFAYDGSKWLEEQLDDASNLGSYDVMLVDSTDYGVAESLFTDAFFRSLKQLMRPEGSVLVINVDSPSWNMDIVINVQRQLNQLFKYSYIYHTHQPCFLSGHYSFLFASDTVHPMRTPVDWSAFRAKDIPTDYYTPDVHYGAFVLPAVVQRRLTMSASFADLPQFRKEVQKEEERQP